MIARWPLGIEVSRQNPAYDGPTPPIHEAIGHESRTLVLFRLLAINLPLTRRGLIIRIASFCRFFPILVLWTSRPRTYPQFMRAEQIFDYRIFQIHKPPQDLYNQVSTRLKGSQTPNASFLGQIELFITSCVNPANYERNPWYFARRTRLLSPRSLLPRHRSRHEENRS